MTSAALRRELKSLPLSLLDPPEPDVRIQRDDEGIEELGRDIARRGLIYPLHVFVKGDRFEVVDGETRRIAMLRQGLADVEAFVYESKSVALNGVKYASNIFRTDMSPADEAKAFWDFYHGDCNQDIEQVARLTGKSLNYVNSRLALVDGDDLVFEAVKLKQITLGVAAELNKIDEPDYRRHYLHHAIRGGATVALVTGWVMEYRASKAVRDGAPPAPVAETTAIVASSYNPHRCYICREADPRFIPEQVPIHTHCKYAVLDKLLGFTAETPSNT